MIFLSDINSIIESIYLEEKVSESIRDSNIHVNPERVTYLTGKIIILNTPDYSSKKIAQLITNNCKIISRLGSLRSPEISYQPYIVRPNFNIMWNGEEVNEEIENALESSYYNANTGKLLFPKITSLEVPFIDLNGDLTALGN